ncbi:MAG: hypothetical protein JEZ12_21620 [Desulfobacterium sp.]|nr:hypothetical protein [Desulfobacterium sp.]
MSFFPKGRTSGTLGGELSNLASKIKANRVAERVDELGPSFLQMGDYTEKGISSWISKNDVTTDELKAMKPIIQQYRESFDRSANQARQVKNDKWVSDRRTRQGVLDGQADADRIANQARQKVADDRVAETYDYNKGQRGKVSSLDQLKMLVEKNKLAKLQNGGTPSVKDQQFQAENAMKDLSSRLSGMGVQVDPDTGSFTIPVNKEGQPDPQMLKMIGRSGFNFTTGKRVMTKDKWGSNNDYGIQVHLGSYKGSGQGQGQPIVSGQGPAPAASSFAAPAPSGGAPAPGEKRVAAADFLNKSPHQVQEETRNQPVAQSTSTGTAVKEVDPAILENIRKVQLRTLKDNRGMPQYYAFLPDKREPVMVSEEQYRALEKMQNPARPQAKWQGGIFNPNKSEQAEGSSPKNADIDSILKSIQEITQRSL